MSGTADNDPNWPLYANLEVLQEHDLNEVRGADRLGALAFRRAPQQLSQVIADLRDLQLEEWESLPGQVSDLAQILDEMNQVIVSMEKLTSASADAGAQQARLQSRLNELFNRFRTIVHPLTVKARVREELARTGVVGEHAGPLEEKLASLSHRAAELEAQLAELAPLADAQREAVLRSGTSDLGAAYESEADRHEKAWRLWLKAFVAVGVVAAVAGLIFVAVLAPEADATNAEIVTTVARDVLFVGLLLYAVRIVSLQFRVHRHLDAVARNKAAALGTFNRLVAGQAEPDVRAAIAASLAHAVFTSEQTGFIGTPDDHVTLIERVVGPISNRASGN